MSKLTEKYERLVKLQTEIEDAVSWLEQNADQIQASITLSAAREGRNLYPPTWIRVKIEKELNNTLPTKIQTLISEKILEMKNAEADFAHSATAAIDGRESSASQLEARVLRTAGYGGKK